MTLIRIFDVRRNTHGDGQVSDSTTAAIMPFWCAEFGPSPRGCSSRPGRPTRPTYTQIATSIRDEHMEVGQWDESP